MRTEWCGASVGWEKGCRGIIGVAGRSIEEKEEEEGKGSIERKRLEEGVDEEEEENNDEGKA